MVGRADFGGLAGRLAVLPKAEQPAEAARQFEALLLAHWLKTVREAAKAPGTEEDRGAGADTYLEIAEQQLAQALAQGGGVGIARMILRNLAPSADKTPLRQADPSIRGQ